MSCPAILRILDKLAAVDSAFQPSLLQAPFVNTTGAQAGRAAALLEASGQPVPYSIAHPYKLAALGAIAGAGVGAGAGYGFGGHWKAGASIGAMIGAAAALLSAQSQMLGVKKNLRSGELEPEFDAKKFKQLPAIATQNEDLALVKGLVTGAHDKAYVDQIMRLRDKTKTKPDTAANLASDVAGKLIPGAGMLVSAPQGADAVGIAQHLLEQPT